MNYLISLQSENNNEKIPARIQGVTYIYFNRYINYKY